MKTKKRYSLEVKERAVRLVLEHQGEYPSRWSAICSISGKIGCTPETLRAWCQRAEKPQVKDFEAQSDTERLKQLEREPGVEMRK